ncbi:MAG: thioredoxin [Acidimicrobiia bacterium]|nr:thioredoxin [Acidimicrobiia bacterium]
MTAARVRFELYSSSFCGACARTRELLRTATGVLTASSLQEYDIAFSPDRAEAEGILATPTVIVRDGLGKEVFRATGVPTLGQVFGAAALAV